MARVLVFDVNETLLDLRALDAPFEHVFGTPDVRREWFSQLLQSAFVATITDAYSDFGTIGRSALEIVARRHGQEIATADRDLILTTMRQLPPHGDVRTALERLRQAGYRLATLTNSTRAVADAQLSHANLASLFERILSADTVRRLKPAREPYQMAARELGVAIGDITLVAAHSWDVIGAMRAGAAAAFVARPGAVLDPLGPTPAVVGPDLEAVATRLIETDRGH